MISGISICIIIAAICIPVLVYAGKIIYRGYKERLERWQFLKKMKDRRMKDNK